MNKNDLNQISQLLDEKLGQQLEPIREELKSHGKMLKSHDQQLTSINQKLTSHDQQLTLINQKLTSHDQQFTLLTKELKKHGKLLHSLKKDQDTMLDMLDREQVSQGRKIKRIEEHLGLSSAA